MPKRGNNEGSIYFDASVGLYRAAVTMPDRRRKTVSARTRKLCASKLGELQAQLAAGLPVGAGDRLDAFLAWWLGTLEAKATAGTRKANTVDNATWAVRTWIIPALGTKRLRDLTPEDVEALLMKMAIDGKSRRSIGRVRTYLGQALAVAERRGKLARNVARLAEVPETDAPTPRRALTNQQAMDILAAARGDRLEALFVTGLMLGLRPGELCGLRWTDVDIEHRRIDISAALRRERGQLLLGEVKTPRSRRSLALPDPVVDALRAQRRRQLDERRTAGAEWTSTGLVFATEVGTPIDPSNLGLPVSAGSRAGVSGRR